MTTKLYIEIHAKRAETKESEDDEIFVSIESFVALFVYRFCDEPSSIELNFIANSKRSESDKAILKLNKNAFKYRMSKLDPSNHEVGDLRMPVFVKESTSIAGLCAVCREIIMEYDGGKNRRELLGFKEASLLAPAECSVLTKFCELDIIDAIKSLQFISTATSNECVLPDAFARFEKHMSQPVRSHNVYKLAREKANGISRGQPPEIGKNTENSAECQEKSTKPKGKVYIQSSTPIKDLKLIHQFAEGCFLTLVDVILYVCYSLCFAWLPNIDELREILPLTLKWFTNINQQEEAFKETFDLMVILDKDYQNGTNLRYVKEETDICSLYKSDPKRYKPRDRIYTKQDCVEESLQQFLRLNISATSRKAETFNEDDSCDNDSKHSYPNVGDLPEKRLLRKKQQLDNLANAVVSIAKDGERIVDFCSGSGHLGIILATRLPKCHIIFLENKSISLKRARDRAEQLNLNNCSFYQSNLDYFIGQFDIGTALHACGTATDIVIWQCIRNRAKFVCCPCCYGSVTAMPHITYPRSKMFGATMNAKNYLYIAHAADQAHNAEKTECNREKSVQGQYCMDIIDTDRKLMAEEAGYKVILTRLQPEDCTPKNRLLIGVI